LFWDIPPAPDRPDLSDEEELRRALRECVGLHLASDVPLGVFLSGGVDSSVVAHLAQEVSQTPIHTFTLSFEEEALNEAPFARKIAEAIGTQHTEILLSEQRFVGNLQRGLDTLDQPTFDGLNSFYMSQAVREAGLTVALVGTGGDELFGGYKSFSELPRLLSVAQRSALVPKPLKVAAAQLVKAIKSPSGGGAVAPQTRWAKLPDMVRAGTDLLALYQLAYALFLPGFQRELLAPDLVNDQIAHGLPRVLADRLRYETEGRTPRSAISVLEQRCFLGERLLRDTDAASMAVSLELRVPLVDHVLLETLTRVPDTMRYAPAKALLRRLGLHGLDPALWDRPKSGFVLPYDTWIRRSLGQAMDDTMRDESLCRSVGLNGPAVARLWQAYQSGAPGMYWSRVWAIYVLLRWCQKHNLRL
jgi:asparagine synthase (glutamine-hydrolysing)